MNVDLLGLSGTGLAVSPASGTGFVTSGTGFVTSGTGFVTSETGFVTSETGFATPSLPFKVSKIIEASKRFGRGYKPRPAWNHIATSETGFVTSGTGLAAPSLTFRKLLKHPNVSVGVTNPDWHRSIGKKNLFRISKTLT